MADQHGLLCYCAASTAPFHLAWPFAAWSWAASKWPSVLSQPDLGLDRLDMKTRP